MKKAELESKLLELEKKIAVLEARPICYGHNCNCNHLCNLPHYPSYPYQPFWTITTGTNSPGVATFGNIS